MPVFNDFAYLMSMALEDMEDMAPRTMSEGRSAAEDLGSPGGTSSAAHHRRRINGGASPLARAGTPDPA